MKNYTVEKVGKYSYIVKADKGYKIVLDAEKKEYADEIQCNDAFLEKHLVLVAESEIVNK